MSNATHDKPPLFHSADWRTVVEVDATIDGGQHYHVDIYRHNVWACRIALTGSFPDQAAAEAALSRRIQAWVADYESRQHTGDTVFNPL